MRLHLLPFIKDLINTKETFTPYDFSNKHKSSLFSLFKMLKLIEPVGVYHKAAVYKKTSKLENLFEIFREIKSEDILQLFFVFILVRLDDIPRNEYSGKILKSMFKRATHLVVYILFQTGMVQKEKKTYKYSPFFIHIIQLGEEERKTLITALITHYNKLEQQLYINTFRSLKHEPDYVSVSFDHGISLKTKWVMKYWRMDKKQDKNVLLDGLAKKDRTLVMFEADRSTKTAKAYITVFPRLKID